MAEQTCSVHGNPCGPDGFCEECKAPHPVEHGGQVYTFLWTQPGNTEVEYLRDEAIPSAVCYRFKVSGAHVGEPIELLMANPRDEDDGEGGRCFVWDQLLWADDQTPITEGDILDTYTDALRDDLENIGKDWD